eukprot:TRINITY_DN17089_c0_g1_i1.p1 TRINITY_DN17089_c0_g1~~TRINITY_DN17089_c0_g1_i1.p1  ORF type:complete len:483 (-),score=107.57 TRINITY_DN17089_c0_g1_i1:6-1454(-)
MGNPSFFSLVVCLALVSLASIGAEITPFTEESTPVLLQPLNGGSTVVAILGSDDHYHVVYELLLLNFGPSISIEYDRLEVYDAEKASAKQLSNPKPGDGKRDGLVAVYHGEDVERLISKMGFQGASSELVGTNTAIVWMDVEFDNLDDVPAVLCHRLIFNIKDTATGVIAAKGLASLNGVPSIPVVSEKNENGFPLDALVLSPPLSGKNYIAADACCSSPRHRRAALPINGAIYVAQRFAIDWERSDDDGRILKAADSDLSDVRSYRIFGDTAYASADGVVVTAIDGNDDIAPGSFPPALPIAEASGNHIVLKLSEGVYLLYAHLQKGSVRVSKGDEVTAGDKLGLVGNSGNTLAPHLHQHVMDGPLPLASNGLAYSFTEYKVTGRVTNIEAFDDAELKNIPFDRTSNTDGGDHVGTRKNAYPMQLTICELDYRDRPERSLSSDTFDDSTSSTSGAGDENRSLLFVVAYMLALWVVAGLVAV